MKHTTSPGAKPEDIYDSLTQTDEEPSDDEVTHTHPIPPTLCMLAVHFESLNHHTSYCNVNMHAISVLLSENCYSSHFSPPILQLMLVLWFAGTSPGD